MQPYRILLVDDEPIQRRLERDILEASDLTCQVREYSDQGPVQHELRKRILRRFREEAIEMPFPARTVYLKQDA